MSRTPSLDHFVDLSRNGAEPGASSSEVQCHQLAECVVNNLRGLDGVTLDGLQEFVELAIDQPMSARELLEQ